jgi:hypothetical protein
MAFGVAGAWLDERSHLGFTTWQSACRAAGFAPRSLVVFTLELLPMAVIGALAGGLIVQLAGALSRGTRCGAQGALAAHAGCALGMMAGLALCALATPWPLALATEALLAMCAAAGLFDWWGRVRAGASVLPPSRRPSSA